MPKVTQIKGGSDKNHRQAKYRIVLQQNINTVKGFPGSSAGKESTCNARHPCNSWVRKIPWRRNRLLTPVFLGFPGGSGGKESTCNVGDLGLISGLGRSPGAGYGSILAWKIPMDRGAWWATVQGGLKETDTTERLSTAQHVH